MTRYWPWLLGGLFFLLYSITAAPSIVALFDDTLEFQLVGPTLRIAHPTGYPLYTLLAAFWSRLVLPVGNWAWRMNLFSALAAATAVGLVYTLARRLITLEDGTPNQTAATVATILFGMGPVWWSQATVAEVYALHGLFVAAIFGLSIGMNKVASHEQKGAITRALNRRMLWLALVCGLALTHHRTTVLVLPPLLLYLWWSTPALRYPCRAWWGWVAAGSIPLLLYLYLPIRAAMGVGDLHGSYVNSWFGFWDHVLARGYTNFFGENPLAQVRTPNQWVDLLTEQMGGVGLLLALLGLGWLVDRRLRLAKAWVYLFLVGLSVFIFGLFYKIPDVEVILIPTYLCLALFAGGGVGLFTRLLQPHPWLAHSITWLLALVLIGPRIWQGYPIDHSQAWASHDYAVAMAKVDFPPSSYVIGIEGEMTALRYMQEAARLGGNATPIVADNPEDRRQWVQHFVDSGQPTFLTRELAGLEKIYSFSGSGPLIRVWPKGSVSLPTLPHTVDLTMVDGALQLVGYELLPLVQAGGPALQLRVDWRVLQQMDQIVKVSLRLQDVAGHPLAWQSGEMVVKDCFPLHQAAYSKSWRPNETIRDVYYLAVPPAYHNDPTHLQLILYNAETITEVGRWEVSVPPIAPVASRNWAVQRSQLDCRGAQ